MKVSSSSSNRVARFFEANKEQKMCSQKTSSLTEQAMQSAKFHGVWRTTWITKIPARSTNDDRLFIVWELDIVCWRSLREWSSILLPSLANFCVPLCYGRSPRDKTSFHRFPRTDNEPEQRTAWKRAVRRDFAVNEFMQVCGKHCPSCAFQERDNGKQRKRTMPYHV